MMGLFSLSVVSVAAWCCRMFDHTSSCRLLDDRWRIPDQHAYSIASIYHDYTHGHPSTSAICNEDTNGIARPGGKQGDSPNRVSSRPACGAAIARRAATAGPRSDRLASSQLQTQPGSGRGRTPGAGRDQAGVQLTPQLGRRELEQLADNFDTTADERHQVGAW